MSFKREGDDQSQLNVLKKRRVAELLSNFIPEDEATLMKNGRYSCLVCSHRPVFDTVDMLTIHRKGKRHLEGLKWFYGKKAQLKKEIDKRRHQEYVNRDDDRQESGSSAPLLTQTRKIAHHALLRSAPYSSCHKKASERSEHIAKEYKPPVSNLIASASPIHTATGKNKINTETKIPSCETNQGQKGKQMKKTKVSKTETEPVTEQRRKELEHYLRLKSSGWLQDSSGKWVKDENVEFDSDEEEPLPLLPSSETT